MHAFIIIVGNIKRNESYIHMELEHLKFITLLITVVKFSSQSVIVIVYIYYLIFTKVLTIAFCCFLAELFLSVLASR